MIDLTLNYIINELNGYLPVTDGSNNVVMGNIGFMESEEQSDIIRNKIVVSLVNLEEESTLKNGKSHLVEGSLVKFYQKPVHLNLYILIAANYRNDKYEMGVRNISKVIEYFQSHRVITHLNAPLPQGGEDIRSFELNMELFALTFEQVNYLWGSLGGKQVPFVLYKCRLIVIKADKTSREGRVVEQIKEKENSY